LFGAFIYHTEKDEDKKTNGEEEIRTKPNKMTTRNIKFANYDKVNKDGVMDKNTLVEDKDIIIAKVTVIRENKNDNTKLIKYEDNSRSYRTDEEAYIDDNVIQRNGDGYNSCKVKVRAFRKPNIGDKFSSRHGQKGTIGNIINEEDMPFTKDGLRPDLIINPHAIPSRMTIAQLKETTLGILLLELGLFGDGTSFGELDMNVIFKKLQEHNYESKGNQILYDGKTGEQIETSIFIGPTYYQRLKHMVNDKQHSRCIGPMVNLTRQPAEGRSRDGGLRFGEMERDCTMSHGAARFTKERTYDVSDKYSVHVCKMCGLIAVYNDKEHIHHCNVCDNKTQFAYVELPYSCKLLFQELISMNVAPRIMT
jgi:DNA-directed RNA polymerase II subunit RPB2